MTVDESEVPKRFRRIADRAGALVTSRMLYGDTPGGWFSDDPVYPPVGAILERDETPVHVIPLLEDESKKAAAFVPTDRRLYLVRGIRGHRGPKTSTTTIPFSSVQQIRTLGEGATTGVKLMLDGNSGRAAVPSDEGSIPSELSIALHDDADPGEAARAVSYVMEQRDGVTERPSGDHAATADTTGDTVENGAAADNDGGAVERLSELATLRDRGAITDEEFDALKRDVLGDVASEPTDGLGSATAGEPAADTSKETDAAGEARGSDHDDASEPRTLADVASGRSSRASPVGDRVSFNLELPDRLTKHDTYYERLGFPSDLGESLPEKAIDEAYEWACDQVEDPQQYRLLDEAYETLSDPANRSQYDAADHHEYVKNY